MNFSTRYLGLKLRNPLVVGASPFCDNLGAAVQLQDAGAAALVMHSLFKEQIELEQRALLRDVESPAESYAEATAHFPKFEDGTLAPDRYLAQIGKLKAALTIPVIASLNGTRPGGWTDYAQRFEAAGADAIELNLYSIVTDPRMGAAQIEAAMIETVRQVTALVKIPVAVKLSAFHTAPAGFARALERAGAAGVVLFNRFYQPDLDLEELEVKPELKLSDSSELLLRLRWLAILSPHLKGSLASTGGAHTAADATKAILAGAHAVQLVSVLLKHGPRVLTTILQGMQHWMDEHGYQSVEEFRGAMNLRRCPDAHAFERANYQRILQSWRV